MAFLCGPPATLPVAKASAIITYILICIFVLTCYEACIVIDIEQRGIYVHAMAHINQTKYCRNIFRLPQHR